MTSRETNSADDAEFEQFLQRKGELALRLQALDQPKPSAELDAAILAGAEERELAAAKRLSRQASNDASMPGARVGRPWFPGRWRMPVGLAASVALGMFLWLQFEGDSGNGRQIQLAQAPAQAPEAARSNTQPADPGKPSSAPPVTPAKRMAPASQQERMAKEAPAPRVMVAQADMDAANGTVLRSVPLPPPPVEAGKPEGGSRDQAQSWLALIEELLKADRRPDAIEEWKNFRKAHPQYAVPDKLLKELKPQASK